MGKACAARKVDAIYRKCNSLLLTASTAGQGDDFCIRTAGALGLRPQGFKVHGAGRGFLPSNKNSHGLGERPWLSGGKEGGVLLL